MSEETEVEHVKVLFRFESNVTDKEHVEILWAMVVDREKGYYQLDSIPFFGPAVSCSDLIFAEYDAQEEMLTYRKTIEPSGNSTVQVAVSDGVEIEEIRAELKAMGCDSERMDEQFFAMEIPVAENYAKIRNYLEEKLAADILEYAEPSISEKHRGEVA